jgi:hypothetical protein
MKNRSISDSYCPSENAYLLRIILRKMIFVGIRKISDYGFARVWHNHRDI